MIAITARSRRLLRSTLFALALVAILSVLAFIPYLGFCAYPLAPGIDLSGLIFSNGIESYHLLRFELAAIFFNILFYISAFYFIFTEPRMRRRRTYSEYFGASRQEPAADASSLPEPPVVVEDLNAPKDE